MFTIVIQAGGESSRMGQDKALVHFLGAPLIQRVFDRVVSLGDEILVTTNRPQAFAFLNAKLATDLLPGRGALGGLYTALNAATFPIVGVVACDMPFANPRLLAALRDRLVETGGAAVIPRNEKGLEPFHAVYQRSACLPFIKASLEADQRRVDSWFSQARVEYFSPEEVQLYDPQKLAFFNVNTSQDLALAEHFAQEQDSI
jgi:molybdopterin-guanine dinucleotide biosynthesis protein A